MAKSGGARICFADTHFNEEVATIVADLSSRLHQLLRQHEASILSNLPPGSQGDLQKRPVLKQASDEEHVHDHLGLATASEDPEDSVTFVEEGAAENFTTISAAGGSTFAPSEQPKMYQSSSARRASPSAMEDVQDSNFSSPPPANSPSLRTSFAKTDAPVDLPWCLQPQDEPPDTEVKVLPSKRGVSGTASAGSVFAMVARQGNRKLSRKSTRRLDLRTCWTEITNESHVHAITHYESRVKIKAVDKCNPNRRKTKTYKIEEEARTRCTKMLYCGILHPAGQARAIWNASTFILIFLDMLTIPLLVFDIGDAPPWQVFAWVCTLFWTVDMILSFRTGFFVGVKVEMRQAQIMKQYGKTWFSLDAFIVVFEWFSRFFNTIAPPSLVRTTRAIRVVRIVKLLRMAKMKDLVREFAEQVKSNVVYLILQICFLTTVLCIGTHFVTCVWYALGQSASDGWTSYDLYAVRAENGVIDKLGFAYWYVSSARWVVSQLNGRTDLDERRNMWERAFTVVAGVLLSLVGHAIFISLITKAMLELSNLFKKKSERRRLVNDYLSLHTIPPTMERSVKYHAKEYKDMDAEKQREVIVLSLLPKHLQSDLLYEVRKPLLTNHPLFKIIMQDFPKAGRHVCQKVANQVYAVRDEIVFNIGNSCNRMLVVDTGALTYQTQEGLDAMAAQGTDASGGHIVDGKPRRFASIQSDGDDKFITDDAILSLTTGTLVSEPALWMNWSNKGQLVTEDSCCMVEIKATLLAQSMEEYSDAFALTVVYARHVFDSFSQEEPLTDIASFDTLNFDVMNWNSAMKDFHEKDSSDSEKQELD